MGTLQQEIKEFRKKVSELEYELGRYQDKYKRQLKTIIEQSKKIEDMKEVHSALKKAAGAQITYFSRLQAPHGVESDEVRVTIPKEEIARILDEYECGAYDDGNGNYVFMSRRKKKEASECNPQS